MYARSKRTFDAIFATILLVLLAPLFVVIAVWIKIESKGPIFFKQRRYGKHKAPFTCLKFRTMVDSAPHELPTRELVNATSYITHSGKVLRRLGIDEIPQLINVLRGEMSLIGPRPVVLAETNLIRERDKYGANSVAPGIGGWAQSNGRDELADSAKARLDGEYVQNFGLAMDISCIWRTAVAVFTSAGFKEGHIGDTEFKQKVRHNTKKFSLLKIARNKLKERKYQKARALEDRVKAEITI